MLALFALGCVAILCLVSFLMIFTGQKDGRVVFASATAICFFYLPLCSIFSGYSASWGACSRINAGGGPVLAEQLRSDAREFALNSGEANSGLPQSFVEIGGKDAFTRRPMEGIVYVQVFTSGAFFPTSWIIIPDNFDFELPVARTRIHAYTGIYREIDR